MGIYNLPIVFSQSKNEQIEKLKIELDSLNSLQKQLSTELNLSKALILSKEEKHIKEVTLLKYNNNKIIDSITKLIPILHDYKSISDSSESWAKNLMSFEHKNLTLQEMYTCDSKIYFKESQDCENQISLIFKLTPEGKVASIESLKSISSWVWEEQSIYFDYYGQTYATKYGNGTMHNGQVINNSIITFYDKNFIPIEQTYEEAVLNTDTDSYASAISDINTYSNRETYRIGDKGKFSEESVSEDLFLDIAQMYKLTFSNFSETFTNFRRFPNLRNYLVSYGLTIKNQ